MSMVYLVCKVLAPSQGQEGETRCSLLLVRRFIGIYEGQLGISTFYSLVFNQLCSGPRKSILHSVSFFHPFSSTLVAAGRLFILLVTLLIYPNKTSPPPQPLYNQPTNRQHGQLPPRRRRRLLRLGLRPSLEHQPWCLLACFVRGPAELTPFFVFDLS